MSLFRTLCAGLALLLGSVAILPACSEVDSSDRDELAVRLSALPTDVYRGLASWAAAKKVADFLKGKGPMNMGKYECRWRYIDTYTGKERSQDWTQVEPKTPMTAGAIGECMALGQGDYVQCIMAFVATFNVEMMDLLNNMPGVHPPDTGMTQWLERKCRITLLPDFDPDRVAADARDASSARVGDMARIGELMTVNDIIDALITSDAPPPLLIGGWGAFAPLLPALCGLSVGWGCPDSPLYPLPRDEPNQGDTP